MYRMFKDPLGSKLLLITFDSIGHEMEWGWTSQNRTCNGGDFLWPTLSSALHPRLKSMSVTAGGWLRKTQGDINVRVYILTAALIFLNG